MVKSTETTTAIHYNELRHIVIGSLLGAITGALRGHAARRSPDDLNYILSKVHVFGRNHNRSQEIESALRRAYHSAKGLARD